jgi:hypothetical protein
MWGTLKTDMQNRLLDNCKNNIKMNQIETRSEPVKYFQQTQDIAYGRFLLTQ